MNWLNYYKKVNAMNGLTNNLREQFSIINKA